MAAIAVRREHRRATLLLGLKGALREAVAGTWHDGNASALPPTGHAAFDALNATLGLRAARSHAALGSVALHLDERANIDAARWAYRAIDGVAYAEPDALLVDGPDIEAAKVRDTWHVVFRKAWGDCPAGCIFRVLSFFTVAGERVERIAPARARAMDPFATLLANRRWR